MYKTYKSKIHQSLSYTLLTKNDKGDEISVKIEFGKGTNLSKAYFTTNDKIKQELLENTADFKNGVIYIDSVVIEKEDKESSEEQTKVLKDITKENIRTDERQIHTYKNKQDLYQQLITILPDTELSSSLSEKQLTEIAEQNGVLFKKG